MTIAHPIRLVSYISKEKIQERLKALVEEIVRDCQNEDIVVIGLLKGSFVFLADLIREFYEHQHPLRIDFMAVSSYGAGTKSPGKVQMVKDITMDIENQTVLLVDDILDSGNTLTYVMEHLKAMHPASVKSCVLLDKPSRREKPIQADYVGFSIDNHFVVGYGLDFDNRYRELPAIALVEFTEESN